MTDEALTTEHVRQTFAYVQAGLDDDDGYPFVMHIHVEAFDAWLAEVERAAAEKAEAERDAALSTIAKVEALHRPFEWSFGYGPVTSCRGCVEQGVDEVNSSWPCPTIRALGSVPSTGEDQL